MMSSKMKACKINLLLFIFFAFGAGQLYAQSTDIKEKQCKLSTEEIISAVKSELKISPPSDAIIIGGEVKSGTQFIHLPKRTLTLIDALAISGGLTIEADSLVYIIRQSADGKIAKSEIDYHSLNLGKIGEFELKKGDLIFVPRSCRKDEPQQNMKKINRNCYFFPQPCINPNLISDVDVKI